MENGKWEMENGQRAPEPNSVRVCLLPFSIDTGGAP